MVKQLLLMSVLLFSTNHLIAQVKVDSTGFTIQQYATLMQENDTLAFRIQQDSLLTLKLWESLSSPYSFQYHFDSLQSVRQISSPDGRFKLFTWQLALNNEHYVQRGIIQFKNLDGTIQLQKLYDVADEIEDANSFEGNAKQWIGAVYYELIQNEFQGKKYYTLLGFDAYDKSITQRMIEVLHFENEQPIFGGDFFIYPPDETYPKTPTKRFIYSYKKGSNAIIRYDSDSKAIVLSELASTQNNLKEKSTLVPTGDEVYFIWKNGKWRMPNK